MVVRSRPAMRPALVILLMICSSLPSAASGQSLVAEKPGFRELVPDGATVEKLAEGFQFLEGPAWNVKGRFLVFSDIPADKMYRYDPATKAVTVFREPSHNANGNFYNSKFPVEFLYTCEHGSRTVTCWMESEGSFTLVDKYEGKKLNSPNDVVVKMTDETVWFTDPTYGLGKAPKEQSTNNVYCYNTVSGELRAVATDFIQPNGLCFSPDEKLLYISDTDKPHHVRVFNVTADNRLEKGRVFCQTDKGAPDGIRCDRHGNLFTSAGDGIHLFAPDGTRLGKILVPETPANLCFGGQDGDELFITARTSLYHIKLTTTAPGKTGQ